MTSSKIARAKSDIKRNQCPVLRNALVLHVNFISHWNFLRKTTWPAFQPSLPPGLLEERLLDLGALVTLLQEQSTQVHATCEAVLAAVERCTAHQAEQAAVSCQIRTQLDRLQASRQPLNPPTSPAGRPGWPRWLTGRRRRREA